jgi:hypothetical protein
VAKRVLAIGKADFKRISVERHGELDRLAHQLAREETDDWDGEEYDRIFGEILAGLLAEEGCKILEVGDDEVH